VFNRRPTPRPVPGRQRSATFGIEYRAYVLTSASRAHGIGWLRGLNAPPPTAAWALCPSSPSNVGKPPALPVNSGTNTFALMLTRINPDASTTLLE
jgi:hypothetical protein